MSGKQRAVLWLGLLLIGLNLVSQWSQIKSVIFTSPKAAPSNGGGNGGGGGLPFPLIPPGFFPGLSASTTPPANQVKLV
jgi:hypothetical protein